MNRIEYSARRSYKHIQLKPLLNLFNEKFNKIMSNYNSYTIEKRIEKMRDLKEILFEIQLRLD